MEITYDQTYKEPLADFGAELVRMIAARDYHRVADRFGYAMADGSGQLVNTGAQRNGGVTLSVDGALTRHWSVYANYTHLNATIT